MRPLLARRSGRDRTPSTTDAKQGEGWSLLRFVLTLVLFAWALRCFVFAPFSIPSGSMLPTLYIGDYLVVAKWPYGYSRVSFPFGIPSFDGRIFAQMPRRGDVIVFRHPAETSDLVKRVMGLAGDTVQVSGGAVLLNGRALHRDKLPPFASPIRPNSPCKTAPGAIPVIARSNAGASCLYTAYLETLPGGPSYTVLDQASVPADDFGPVTVPPGHVFLMGDNRDDSLDSRFSLADGGIAMVPIDQLIGRALVTFWSTDGSASYWKPWTWFTALRGSRIGNGYAGPPE